MPVNLLSYTGTPALGIGSSDAPVAPTNPDLNVINNTIRDVMLLDNQKNIQLWQQRVKDRDNLLEMISKNQVSSGDILPEYRQHFDQAERQAEAAFSDWKGNLNDKEGYRKYQAAIQDLKDIATHAQGKTVSIRELEKQKSQEVLPRKQAELQQWIDKEKAKPFWDQVTPYQQLHDFSIDDILSGVKPFTTTATDKQDPTKTYDVTYVDFNDILRNKRSQYLNDRDAADSIDQFFDKLQRLAPNQLVPTLDAIDARIDNYNKDRGFNPGDNGYVEKIKRANVNGQTLIQDPKTDFAAKYALAQQGQFLTRTPKFNKDIAKYEIDKAKLGLQAKKLGIEAGKAGAYIRNLNAKTDKYLRDQKSEGTNVVKQYEDFVNAINPLNTTDKKTGNVLEKLNIVLVDRLPENYRYIGGPIMGTDKNGKPTGKITVGKLEPFISTDATKRPYYITRYVNSATGDQLEADSDFINNTYKTWRGGGYPGTKEDMVKTLLKNGALEMILQGKNGAANYTSMAQSAKAINAIGTTKGEENIMNPPNEAPLATEPETE
jgi:hypothetical protein